MSVCKFCNLDNKQLNTFCEECGKIILIEDANYFDFFGIQESFDIDLRYLNSKLIEALSKVHPDKFINASDKERSISMSNTQKINAMHRVLKDPILRAGYILDLQGIDYISAQLDDMEFLAQTMEWREGEASLDDVKKIWYENINAFSKSLDNKEYELALTIFLKLKFIKRFMNEVDI